MASNHPKESTSSRDNDIQVINRDDTFHGAGGEEYPHHANLVSPSFPPLDIPSPGNPSHLFDEFEHNVQNEGVSQRNEQHQQHNEFEGKPSESLTPSLSPLTEFVNTHGEHIINEHGNGDQDRSNHAGVLTRFNNANYMPPMAPLSESVLPSVTQNQALLPNTFANSNNQLMLSSGKRKKDSQGPKTKPAFVMKVWSMVNDPKNQEYIRWNEDGLTFQVFHREEFMKSILPKYFKHNNFASFVRQLNMYGWHKVQDITSGSMAKDSKNAEEVWQFKNPYFVRGREDLLDNIVRNKSGTQEDSVEPNVNFQILVTELDKIKMNQLAIIEDMRRIRKDNQTLWSESYTTRERYSKQAQTLDKIMKFLAAVYGNSAGKIFEVEDGSYNSNYGPPALYQGTQPTRPPYPAAAPISKSRLMLMDQEHSTSPSSDTTTSKSARRESVPASKDGSIEEIVRNDHITPHDPSANVSRIYQQIMNQEPGAHSPRQYFPELNSPIMPGTPSQQFAKLGSSAEPNSDVLQGLEQNIAKQGQALSQVQDWIQTLANRQQQQQHQLQQQKSSNSSPSNTELDDFDVNEFLNNSSSNPIPNTDEDFESDKFNTSEEKTDDNKRKRHIEEITEEPRPRRGRSRKSARR
ncbi:Heat shock transcription factor [Candidozyma auris]|uniref:Heat shock transcription factor n=2 Tax=Candidozyma auris TaxID=498019 RepID=A0A2H1A003_CANAR|nr:stress-responsive transcription factor HSF1 [[Candida] auris]KNE02379.2 hypothetical protein QG37_00637 [[Candida] auris]PIS56239.1 hypothetical protein CJI97_001486 [[Candida] auris]PIS56583.1 hypothetical protein B9J08_001120 [[Candida] auris]QEO22110.1 hypothetical_protein [[Candida] auris]QWW24134.1 hypothetical protein CA7LBN_002968 [[Candida] auris]